MLTWLTSLGFPVSMMLIVLQLNGSINPNISGSDLFHSRKKYNCSVFFGGVASRMSPNIYNNAIKVKIMRIILLLLLGCLITSCAQIRLASIDVTYGERQTLYFTGRGSAAGIMMDSLLGGAGIAIGIAIDEGIAKDISAAIVASNPKFSMDILVKAVLHQQVSQGINIDGLKSIVINKYGFQSAPDDKVVPLLELQFICESGVARKVTFASSEKTLAITFEQSKTDGKLVEEQLRSSVESVLNAQDHSCSK